MKYALTTEELARGDTHLGVVLDSIFDGVYIVDRKRRIIFWNRGAEKITGYNATEVKGRLCSEGILNHIDTDGNLLCRSACPLLKTIRTGEEIEAKVYPTHKNGHRFPTLTHVAPIKDDKGKIIAGIEIFRDISLEEDFRHLQEKFNALIKKYVSAATFEEVMAQARAGTEVSSYVRDLTVLFLDIVNFTAFSETRPPQEVISMLNEVFGVCEVVTRECHGDIDKFIGDCVMAVFIDANDAVEAACRILHTALPRLNDLRQERGEGPIQIRIGINSGQVIQGDVGSSRRKDLTVIGDVVNTASRIQNATSPNTVAISEAAYGRLRPEMAARFSFLRHLSVKGKKKSIPVFLHD